MVGAMAKTVERNNNDDLVLRARTDADALGRLYDLYYERIYRFCLLRVFERETAEDLTSTIFLQLARSISRFAGKTEQDFANWLYRIAANHANSYIRKSLRRKQLRISNLHLREPASTGEQPQISWPTLHGALMKLKPKHQTIITLRFFEKMDFEQIAKIVKAKPVTVRVTLHRILRKLRNHLQTIADGGK
jgi:RNA polymerase sigma-70 factor (ECF subfamily)